MQLSRSLAPALLVVGLVVAGRSTRAEPDAGGASCQADRGSLAFLGCSLAQKLGPAARNASVVVVDLKSDRELANAGGLRERVQNAVLAALRPPTEAAKPESKRLRLELAVEKNGGVLRVTADLRRATGLWQRVRQQKARAEAHAFVEVPLDAELRALIPPPPLVISETLKVAAPERGIVALACGALAGDGGQELLLVSRSHVRVGRLQGGKFSERAKTAWATLSPIAPAPLREAIASAEVTPSGTLKVGLTDRRDGVELGPDLSVLQRFESVLPLGTGCTARLGLGVAAELLPCAGGAAARSAPIALDAIASSPLGWVGRELGSGQLISGRAGLAPLSTRVGAQLAVGDADSDGALELAYSLDTHDLDEDRVTLVTLQGKKPVNRFELRAPGVTAIAICQRHEGPGMAPLVVATNHELWLLR